MSHHDDHDGRTRSEIRGRPPKLVRSPRLGLPTADSELFRGGLVCTAATERVVTVLVLGTVLRAQAASGATGTGTVTLSLRLRVPSV